jgi:chromosome segregation ATPase
MSSTFRSTSSTRRSSLHSKPLLNESSHQITRNSNLPSFEKYEKSPNESQTSELETNNREIQKFNENTYSFAKILNQIVEKVCDDIETRLSRLELKFAKFEQIYEEKSSNDFKENHRKNENKMTISSIENFTERLDSMEEGLSGMKSEFFLRQSQIKKLLETNKEKIFEEIRGKMEELKKEISLESFPVKEIKKNIEKIRQGLEELEIRGENQRVNIRRIEDDLVRVLGGMKEMNELKIGMKINTVELEGVKREMMDTFNKRGRSHRDKY